MCLQPLFDTIRTGGIEQIGGTGIFDQRTSSILDIWSSLHQLFAEYIQAIIWTITDYFESGKNEQNWYLFLEI